MIIFSKITPTTIDSEELYQQLQNQDDVYLLDVREPSELEVTVIYFQNLKEREQLILKSRTSSICIE